MAKPGRDMADTGSYEADTGRDMAETGSYEADTGRQESVLTFDF